MRLQIKALDEDGSGLDRHEPLRTDDRLQSFVFPLRQHRRGAENLFIITSEKHQVKSPSSKLDWIVEHAETLMCILTNVFYVSQCFRPTLIAYVTIQKQPVTLNSPNHFFYFFICFIS